MAIRKVTESTDIYSFEEQIPKMFDVFVQKGVINSDYSSRCSRLLNTAINSMEEDLDKLGEYLKSTVGINAVKKYTNNIENKHYVLNAYFNRLKVLYKRVVNLDESNPSPKYDQKIEDTYDDLREAVKDFFESFYDI